MVRSTWTTKVVLAVILTLTLWLYHRIGHYDFIHYDDKIYVTDNSDIRDFSFKGIKKIFLNPENPGELKPPFTILTLAINYKFSGLNPGPYHLTNLFLHLLNILLVFLLVKKVTTNKWAGLFVCAVFAFHPNNAEAVAWASARKEVLFTFFYLSALILVIRFWEKRRYWLYTSAVLLFVLSYFSKYSAATFPILYVALAIFWKNRRDFLKVFLESIPFAIWPLYSVYRMLFPGLPHFFSSYTPDYSPTFFYISEIKIVPVFTDFSIVERFFLGGYSFLVYLIKYLFPLNQQLVYPYPGFTEAGMLPAKYYWATAATILILAVIVIYFIKKPRKLQESIGFAAIFFMVNMSILLHILPIGGRVIIAERYTYILYIGLSITLFLLLQQLTKRFPQKTNIVRTAGLLYIFMLVFLLHNNIPKWESTETVFKDLISKEKEYPIAYNNLGVYYGNKGHYEKALHHYNKAIEIAPNYANAIYNRARLYAFIGQTDKAIEDVKKNIEILPYEAGFYFTLARLYASTGNTEKALTNYHKTLALDSYFYLAYYNIGGQYYIKEMYDSAAFYFNKATAVNPGYALAYNALGLIKTKSGAYKEAANFFDKAITYGPEDINPFLNKANVYIDMGMLPEALELFTSIIKDFDNNSEAYIGRGKVYLQSGLLEKACADFHMALNQGNDIARVAINQYCL